MAQRTLDLGAIPQSPEARAPKWPSQGSTGARLARSGDFATAGALGRQSLVLQILIEDFGGEATASSLCRRVIGEGVTPVWSESRFGDDIRAALDSLQASGAVSIERLSGTEVVARITRRGARLADQNPPKQP